MNDPGKWWDNFRHNLRRARLAKGISQNDLAATSKVDRGLLSAIECGRRNPSLNVAIHCAKALDVTIDELVKE